MRVQKEIKLNSSNVIGQDSQYQYLDLLKRSLHNDFYDGHEYMVRVPSNDKEKFQFQQFLQKGEFVVSPRQINEVDKEYGRIWPPTRMAHTMIGRKRLDNLQYCIETVLRDGIAGDFIETGVWRGGATIFMRGCLKIFGDSSRQVWVADSFQGLPPPNPEHAADAGDVHHTIPELAVSAEDVRRNFQRYGLLDERVRFLEGWFNQTLAKAPIHSLALIRLDGDMYGSTMDALTVLYPKLASGGFLIIDDYCLKPCAQAIHDYRESHCIIDTIIDIDGTGAFWRKS